MSQMDFVGLGTVPKRPLQKAMGVGLHHKAARPPQPKTAAQTMPNVASRGTTRTTSTGQRRTQSTPGREPLEHPDNADLTNLLVSFVAQSSLLKKEVPVFNGDPLEYQLFMQAFKHNIEDKTDNSNTKENGSEIEIISTANSKDAFSKPCVFCKREHAMEICQTMSKLPHEQKEWLLFCMFDQRTSQ